MIINTCLEAETDGILDLYGVDECNRPRYNDWLWKHVSAPHSG